MISQSTCAKIFEPFYTTKSNGTGLGLAVVAAVAKVHQGNVSLTSNEQETVFTITIPKYEGNLEPSESLNVAVEQSVA